MIWRAVSCITRSSCDQAGDEAGVCGDTDADRAHLLLGIEAQQRANQRHVRREWGGELATAASAGAWSWPSGPCPRAGSAPPCQARGTLARDP